MKYPKVAIAVPVFPNIVQTYVINQLATFKTMGVHISILAHGRKEYKELPLLITNNHLLEDVIYIKAELSSIPKQLLTLPIFNPKFSQAFKKIIFSKKKLAQHGILYKFKALIRCKSLTFRDFDIIHSHSMFSSYNFLFMKEVLSIPMITTYHGQVPKGVNKLDDEKLKMVLEAGDAFIVNTNFARNELIQLGCPQNKIHTIPQGTYIDHFPFKPRKVDLNKKIILLTVARLSIEKGHHIAINAVAALTDRFPNLEYHIVGDGPQLEELTILSRKLNLSNKIIFHGFKTGSELMDIFDLAHIFVLPSINTNDGYLVETQGVVLQEAQASGIPVIGSRTGGIPDVINHELTGLLYEESEQLDLAEAIERLIIDTGFYDKLSVSGRRDVEERFDIKTVCNQLLNTYNLTLNSGSVE